jgi:hypothetical protein
MNVENLRSMAWRWGVEVAPTITSCPPEARFITGDQSTDGKLHYFEQDSGLQLTLSADSTMITDYQVVDKEKFVMFILRWS